MIKIEYKKHLNNIENDVKNTINVLNERNQARIKNEIQMAQKEFPKSSTRIIKLLLEMFLNQNRLNRT